MSNQTLEILHKLLLSLSITVSFLFIFDFIVYTLKSAPKSATLNKGNWRFGFLCTVNVIFWILTNFKGGN